MEKDFDVLVTFCRVGEGCNSELEIRLGYKGISRVVIEGQEYVSMVPSSENDLLLVDSKIKEFDRIIQKSNPWDLFKINVMKDKSFYSTAMSLNMNTSQLDKEQAFENFLKLFLSARKPTITFEPLCNKFKE
jgi:hypothetical protein